MWNEGGWVKKLIALDGAGDKPGLISLSAASLAYALELKLIRLHVSRQDISLLAVALAATYSFVGIETINLVEDENGLVVQNTLHDNLQPTTTVNHYSLNIPGLPLTLMGMAFHEVDKIYSFLGLIINRFLGLEPYYAIPVEEAYIAFTRSHIEHTKSPAILRTAGLRPSKSKSAIQLPSWVPYWQHGRDSFRHLLNFYHVSLDVPPSTTSCTLVFLPGILDLDDPWLFSPAVRVILQDSVNPLLQRRDIKRRRRTFRVSRLYMARSLKKFEDDLTGEVGRLDCADNKHHADGNNVLDKTFVGKKNENIKELEKAFRGFQLRNSATAHSAGGSIGLVTAVVLKRILSCFVTLNVRSSRVRIPCW
jgi:hypothetical protein